MSVSYTHPRYEMVAFLPEPAQSVLDIGCSSGAFGRVLRSSRGELRMVGIEPDGAAAMLAGDVYDHVVAGRFPDAQDKLPVGELFDAIYFNDVLEHMTDPHLALRAARNLLSRDGVIIASIPNIRHISVLGPLILRDDFKYRDSGILDRTHIRFFTARSIRRLFEDEGCAIAQLRGINRVLHIGESRRRWWIAALGLLSRSWTDGFFFVQYVTVTAPGEVGCSLPEVASAGSREPDGHAWSAVR